MHHFRFLKIFFGTGFRCIAYWLDSHILYIVLPLIFSVSHLAPHTVNTIVLTCISYALLTSLWLFCHYWCVCFLVPVPLSPSPPTPPLLWQPPVLSLYLWVCFNFVHLFCSLDSTCKWNHIFVFVWLISLSTCPLGPSMMSQMVRYQSFLWPNNYQLYMCTTTFVCVLF